MSAPDEHGTPGTVTKQSQQSRGRYRMKSEGRSRWMTENINAKGKRGPGGRPLEHGEYALAARYKRGVGPEGPLFPILRQHRDAFLADLGGEANASAKEIQACEYLSFLTVLYGLQVAQLSQAKRMSRREPSDLTQAVTRTAATFGQIAKQLGFQRRQVEVSREIIVRRFASAPDVVGKDSGQGQAGAAVQDDSALADRLPAEGRPRE
jgi:hypothetical protein